MSWNADTSERMMQQQILVIWIGITKQAGRKDAARPNGYTTRNGGDHAVSGNPDKPNACSRTGAALGAQLASQPESPGAGLSLLDVIREQIIPRLMQSHHPAPPETTFSSTAEPAEAARFGALAVGVEEQALAQRAQALLQHTLTLDGLIFDLVPAAARWLGEQWEQDRLDFTEVTLGLWRLHVLVRELMPGRQPEDARLADTPQPVILLSPAPGEHHTLGLLLVAEGFLRAGWMVEDLTHGSADELLRHVQQNHYTAVGLSIGSTHLTEETRSLTHWLRETSYNPGLVILVGGHATSVDGVNATSFGADLICTDPLEAPEAAARLASQSPTEPRRTGSDAVPEQEES